MLFSDSEESSGLQPVIIVPACRHGVDARCYLYYCSFTKTLEAADWWNHVSPLEQSEPLWKAGRYFGKGMLLDVYLKLNVLCLFPKALLPPCVILPSWNHPVDVTRRGPEEMLTVATAPCPGVRGFYMNLRVALSSFRGGNARVCTKILFTAAAVAAAASRGQQRWTEASNTQHRFLMVGTQVRWKETPRSRTNRSNWAPAVEYWSPAALD